MSNLEMIEIQFIGEKSFHKIHLQAHILPERILINDILDTKHAIVIGEEEFIAAEKRTEGLREI